MRHKIQCLVVGFLVSGLLMVPAFAASMFPDVDEYSEYTEAVAYVCDAGIMVGDDNGNFNPDNNVNRAEMATIICRMIGETDGLQKSPEFSDVPVSHWANAYVSKAAELGIVKGYGGGKFGPSDAVTYEQAITMVIRVLEGEELAQSAGGYPNGYLALAEEHGFLEGIKKESGDSLSRSDIAILLMNCSGFHFIADSDSAQHE